MQSYSLMHLPCLGNAQGITTGCRGFWVSGVIVIPGVFVYRHSWCVHLLNLG